MPSPTACRSASSNGCSLPSRCCTGRRSSSSTSRVDPVARDAFWRTLIDLSRDDGVTIFLSTHFMNEAERCDRIVYINMGDVMARGTVADVIAQSHLFTFIIEGDGARALAAKLHGKPGVEFVAFFGAALHISGKDRAKLEALLETLELGSLCAHGGGMPAPIRSLLKHFPDELGLAS